MELRGQVAVVTGGGGGIGEGLARAFAAEGARAVVVADIDGGAAEQVAKDIGAGGGTAALGLAVDAGSEADVQALVARTEARLRPGRPVLRQRRHPDDRRRRGPRRGLGADLAGQRGQPHLRRPGVLPSMLARGEGYLLHTASAAGLLTQLGSAPYSVTKHAVVGLAEWLAITHGDAGVRVSCLCPQAVATAMIGGARRSVGEGGVESTAGRDGILSPAQVAEVVVDALRAERFLILPTPRSPPTSNAAPPTASAGCEACASSGRR